MTFDALLKGGPKGGQDVPRGHGLVLDPTGKHLVVTDHGADKIRVFGINADNSLVKETEMDAAPGSAPRHAAFYSRRQAVYLFILAENANTITTYKVTYNKTQGLMELAPPSAITDTSGGTATTELLSKAKAGEIKISPDNKFVVVSNRLDSFRSSSDSLSTYRINADSSLAFVQRAVVGGISPRHFAINKAGDKVLVSLVVNSTIAVLSRDVATGNIGASLATLAINTTVPGTTEHAGIPAAIWCE